ncbi:MAG: (Fe-S)-binding protein [Anaerolineales bacterium]|nr:(Fe-S)-binding protein [Anaerolineales bacterium]
MSRLAAHKKALYELRFSPMCKPAGEVANLSQYESHTTRSRMMMLWRISEGYLQWGARAAELLYQSTLDSVSQAFDIFHYPVSQYMLDARADVWDAGLAPAMVKEAIEAVANSTAKAPEAAPATGVLIIAGEIAQLSDSSYLSILSTALKHAKVEAAIQVAQTGAVAYALGAWEIARRQAKTILKAIEDSQAQVVIADGPETAWALTKIFPALGITLPEHVQVELLSETLARNSSPLKQSLGKVFVHDSRPAYLIADREPSHLAILPGYLEDEAAFGAGAVYEAPRSLIDAAGGERVFGAWTRGLAKSCGADDGLWLTYPDLARGLALQRLDYAKQLGADRIISDSPLCANLLMLFRRDADPIVNWLPELLLCGGLPAR